MAWHLRRTGSSIRVRSEQRGQHARCKAEQQAQESPDQGSRPRLDNLVMLGDIGRWQGHAAEARRRGHAHLKRNTVVEGQD